jgi:hypothetical protein
VKPKPCLAPPVSCTGDLTSRRKHRLRPLNPLSQSEGRSPPPGGKEDSRDLMSRRKQQNLDPDALIAISVGSSEVFA